jgi:hypothetical protein
MESNNHNYELFTKNTTKKSVLITLILVAVCDFIITMIGIFYIGNSIEAEIIPRFVIEYFGFCGFAVLGLIYLISIMFIYKTNIFTYFGLFCIMKHYHGILTWLWWWDLMDWRYYSTVISLPIFIIILIYKLFENKQERSESNND